MALSADDIIKIIEKCNELGIVENKAPVPEPDLKEISKAFVALEEPSEEELLYWATPYYDVLMAEREERQQRLKQEKELKNG